LSQEGRDGRRASSSGRREDARDHRRGSGLYDRQERASKEVINLASESITTGRQQKTEESHFEMMLRAMPEMFKAAMPEMVKVAMGCAQIQQQPTQPQEPTKRQEPRCPLTRILDVHTPPSDVPVPGCATLHMMAKGICAIPSHLRSVLSTKMFEEYNVSVHTRDTIDQFMEKVDSLPQSLRHVQYDILDDSDYDGDKTVAIRITKETAAADVIVGEVKTLWETIASRAHEPSYLGLPREQSMRCMETFKQCLGDYIRVMQQTGGHPTGAFPSSLFHKVSQVMRDMRTPPGPPSHRNE
jgi:hypothetical protein